MCQGLDHPVVHLNNFKLLADVNPTALPIAFLFFNSDLQTNVLMQTEKHNFSLGVFGDEPESTGR